jgi:hypothetical protein
MNVLFGKDGASFLPVRQWRNHERSPEEPPETVAVVQHWGGERAEFLGGDDVGSFEEALQRADFEKPFPEVVRDGGGTECRVPLETFPEKRMRAFSLGDGDPAGTQEPQEDAEENSVSGGPRRREAREDIRDAKSLHGHTPVSLESLSRKSAKMPSHDEEIPFTSEFFRRRMSFHLLHRIGAAKCLRSAVRVYVLSSSKAMGSLNTSMDADAVCFRSHYGKCGRLMIP